MRRERAPIWIAILAALGAAFFVVPLVGLVVRTPWGDALQSVTSTDTLQALKLSLIAPSLFAVAIICWARALGEFGATITFAGNFPCVTQTMPLAVYLLLETNPESSFILSLVLLAVSVGVLVALRNRWLGSA